MKSHKREMMLRLMVMAARKVGRKRFAGNKAHYYWNRSKPFPGCINSHGPTGSFAHGKKGLNPREMCFVCGVYSPSETAHQGNHYGYTKKNKRITHDIPRATSWGLPRVYPQEQFHQSGSSNRKPQNTIDTYLGFPS